jgi:uncharacterized peroxidase-related enzyme
MPRIRPLAVTEVDPDARAVFDAFQAQRGNVPNMFRTLAMVPAIMTTAAAHMRAVFTSGTVPLRLKELLTVRVSQVNACAYCLASHSALLKQLGATDETIAELEAWEASGAFTPAEKAALAFAEQMTRDAKRVDDALWAELASHYTDSEIVELASVIGLFNYFNRFNDALQVEITR